MVEIGAEAVEEEYWKRRSRSKGKLRITIWVEEMVRERKDAAEEEDEEENEKLWSSKEGQSMEAMAVS